MLTCFAPNLTPAAATYQLSEEESKHAVRVLRLGAGTGVFSGRLFTNYCVLAASISCLVISTISCKIPNNFPGSLMR